VLAVCGYKKAFQWLLYQVLADEMDVSQKISLKRKYCSVFVGVCVCVCFVRCVLLCLSICVEVGIWERRRLRMVCAS
jgi:hypothetical protein